MAFSIDLNILTKYLYEILAVFGLLLAIRAILSVIAVRIMKKPQSWAVILTMAGIKGGLSLIMVHSLPNFELKEMLTAIVVGNVLLSTYLNTVMLMIYLKTKPRLVNSI
jgi:CPA1 family monovalent cation:H+ antiporter